MRIDEFTNKKDERELPFSVAEDLMVFMRNDPTFYRKKFYPCMEMDLVMLDCVL